MTALVVLGVLGLTALFLAGLLTYLYRWRVRKRLFPQLPRLWKRDRSRFFISSALFIVSLLAFMVVSLATGPSLPEPPKKLVANEQQGPSFDGAPPPPMPRPAPAQPAEPTASAAQPQQQLASPAPSKAGDQLGLPANRSQSGPTAPPAQQTPSAQAIAPGSKPAAEQASPQTSQEPVTAKPSQVAEAQPKTEAPVKEFVPENKVAAQSETTMPQVQPAAEAEQPKAEKKSKPPKAAAVKQASKPAEAKTPAKPAAAKKVAAKPEAKTKPSGKAFTVCAASFKDRESAQRYTTRLAKKGLKGKVVKAKIKEKGVWYRVCLGEFASTKKAAAKAKAWRDNDLIKTPFVVRLR
jgi:hypothetical protein